MAAVVAVGPLQSARAAEGYADLPVGRVFYLDSGGEGEAVVFLHARSGNSLLFEHQVEPFTRAGYRFIAYDRVGQGRSTPAGSTSGDPHAELEQLMDHLRVARFHLVGVAAGGGVALEHVLAHPQRVVSVTIANSIGNVQDPDYLALGRRMRPPEFDRLPLELRELGPSYRAANPEGVRRWLELSTSGQQRPPGAAPASRGGARHVCRARRASRTDSASDRRRGSLHAAGGAPIVRAAHAGGRSSSSCPRAGTPLTGRTRRCSIAPCCVSYARTRSGVRPAGNPDSRATSALRARGARRRRVRTSATPSWMAWRATATAISNETARKRDTDGNNNPDARSSLVTCAASASDATFVIASVTLRALAAIVAKPQAREDEHVVALADAVAGARRS